jgi:hypothetical protein
VKLLIHIVTHGRPALLRDCVESVARFLPEETSVNIIINGECRESERWLESFAHPAFRWQTIAREPRPLARNRAFDGNDADIVYFLDDDVVVASPVFHRARALFEIDRDLVVLGGPNLTLPDSSYDEKLFGSIMTSPFAAPMVSRRYGSDPRPEFDADEHSLILCNLAVRPSGIPHWLRLRGHLKSNEENLFLYECQRLGLPCRFSAALGVYHRRRKDIWSFTRQVYSYGFGRAQQTWEAPRSCHPAFLTPALMFPFVAAAIWFPASRAALLALAALHFLLSLAAAAGTRHIRELGPRAVLLGVPLTFLVHSAYGLGFWRGLTHSFQKRFSKGTVSF